MPLSLLAGLPLEEEGQGIPIQEEEGRGSRRSRQRRHHRRRRPSPHSQNSSQEEEGEGEENSETETPHDVRESARPPIQILHVQSLLPSGPRSRRHPLQFRLRRFRPALSETREGLNVTTSPRRFHGRSPFQHARTLRLPPPRNLQRPHYRLKKTCSRTYFILHQRCRLLPRF